MKFKFVANKFRSKVALKEHRVYLMLHSVRSYIAFDDKPASRQLKKNIP